MSNRGGANASHMPLDALLTDDGETPCQPPDDCPVCNLWPRDGEDTAAYLARLGDLYRLAVPGGDGRFGAAS